MKNKFLYALLAAAVLGLSLGSCSKEGVDGTDPEEPAVPVGEPGYLSFNLTNAPGTRALEAPDPGTNQENYVGWFWMLLYDTDGKLRYAWELSADNTDGATNFTGSDVATGAHTVTPSPTSFVTKGREILSREYKLAVIANPDLYATAGMLTSFTGGGGINSSDPFYNLSGLLAVNAGGYNGNTNEPFINGESTAKPVFMMTNANGLITVLPANLQKDATEAEKNPVAIQLDRGVAKLMLNENTTGTPIKTGGTLVSLEWGLENINKKAYGIRKFTYLGSNIQGLNNYRGDMETESNSSPLREYQYAEDPNFSTYDADDFRNENADPNATGSSKNFVAWNAVNNNTIDEVNWKYVYENTLDFATQSGSDWARSTTQIVVNAVITYDFALKDSPATNDYYSWNAGTDASPKWRVFSHAQLIDWMANGYPGEMEDLAALAGYTDNMSVFQSGTSSFFATDGLSSAKPAVSGALGMVQDNAREITFHKGGFNQYRIPIKHFKQQFYDNEQDRTGVYGHYGVVRNNVYRVTLNSINGPGTPTSGWFSASITINPWQRRGQSEDI